MVEHNIYFKGAGEGEIAAYARRIRGEASSGEVGYYHLPDFSSGDDMVGRLDMWAQNKSYSSVVLIGVGGSSLGARAIYEMLGGQKSLVCLDNLDPFDIAKKLQNISINNAIFILCSKSGTTIEPLSIFKCTVAKMQKDGADLRAIYSRFIAITDPGSLLEKWAAKNDIAVFNIPKNVGGRFSVLFAPGLVPLYLCGIDIHGILAGAKACKEHYFKGDLSIIQKAYHYATHSQINCNIIFAYCSRLKAFGEWFVQLWGESLGKKRGYKRVGPTPVALIGSSDQHSFLQLIMQGPKDKTVSFITIKNHATSDSANDIIIPPLKMEGLEMLDFVDNIRVGEVLAAQARATRLALMSENISTDELIIERLDEWHAGWLIYYYELLTSAMGTVMGINTYDQPGVELGKMLLKKLISGDKF